VIAIVTGSLREEKLGTCPSMDFLKNQNLNKNNRFWGRTNRLLSFHTEWTE
jgi:hypothetical protein